jgi:hypothetical protein
MRFADLPKWGVRVPLYVILWSLAAFAFDRAGALLLNLTAVLAAR